MVKQLQLLYQQIFHSDVHNNNVVPDVKKIYIMVLRNIKDVASKVKMEVFVASFTEALSERLRN